MWIRRKSSERFASNTKIEAAGPVPVDVCPLGSDEGRRSAFLPCEKRWPPLAIFVHDAVIDVALLEPGPKIAVGFIVLVAPEEGASNPVIFLKNVQLMLQDVHAEFVGFHGIRCEDAGSAEFGDDEHFVGKL